MFLVIIVFLAFTGCQIFLHHILTKNTANKMNEKYFSYNIAVKHIIQEANNKNGTRARNTKNMLN
jgi:type III secretory pathway lipoprotein EscJ